jgi:hypothetical protein
MILAVLAMACTTQLDAQTCDGRPGRDVGHRQLGAYFEAFDGGRAMGGGTSMLGERMYGGGEIGFAYYDELEGTTIGFSGFLGRQVPLGGRGTAQVCPFIGAGVGLGPNNLEGTGVNATSSAVALGLSWGVVAAETPRASIIPNGSLTLVRSSLTLSNGVDSVQESDWYGVFLVGLGFVQGRQFSIRPYLSHPIGLGAANSSLGVSATLTVP